MAYIGAGITRFNTADELTVTGTSEFGGSVSFGDNNITNVGSLQIDSIAGDADTNTNITFAGSDVITMTTAGSERLRIDSSGRVGIGTTAPDQTLVVKTADGGGIAIENAAGNQYRWAVNSDDSFAVIDSGTAERLRIDSSGNVGIGTTSLITTSGRSSLTLSTAAEKGELHLQNRTATTSSDAGVLTYYNGSNRIGAIQSTADGATDKGKLIFLALNGGSVAGRMDLTEHGLTFNGDAAAANALSDYEEGTWTPSVRGSTTNGSFAGSNTTGFYTKIGDTVHAWFDCDGTISGAAGIIIFTGLPYASISTVEAVGQFMFSDLNTVDATRTNHVLYLGGNATEMSIFASKDDAAWVQVDITNESIGIRAQITYKTA